MEEMLELIEGLRAELDAIKNDLKTERENSEKMRREGALQLELSRAGAKDLEYLIYKTNSDDLFDENGKIIDAEGYINSAKERYPDLFYEKKIDGVLPGESSGRADAGVMTYSQAMKRQFTK